MLDDVMGIFDSARSAGVPVEVRIEAADALGRAGDSRLDLDRQDRYVLVPAGTFRMGAQSKDARAPNFDPDAYDAESPVHEVELSEFRIGRYPVTVVEYERFIADEGYGDTRWWTAGSLGTWSEPVGWAEQREHPNRPVTGVSWFEAAAYAAWAGGRLPTEAEWERAARGTDGRPYRWGEEPADPARLNFGESRVGQPTPVGIYPDGVGPGGIHDMAGNVWEWCHDWFEDRYYASSPRENPKGPKKGVGRVVRGGSWYNSAGVARSAYRLRILPDIRIVIVGFRVVVVGVARTR